MRPSRVSLRRGVLVAFLPIALALVISRAAEAQKIVKVGVILTYSGPDASLSEPIDRAFELYMKLHKQDLPPGVEVQVIKRDDTGPKPDVAKRLAQELIVRDHIQILSGGLWTPNVAATAPLATDAKIPYVLMSSGTASTTRLSPYIARFSFTQWQMSYQLGKWAPANGRRTAVTLVSDYAPGYDGEAAFTRGFTEGGGSIVTAMRIPVASPDYVPFLERARQLKPDCLYVFSPGGSAATAFIKAYHELGLDTAGIQLVTSGGTLPDDELRNMGDAALGVISASHYSASGDRPANRAFVAEWKKAYGPDSLPNYFSPGGWDGMAAIYELARRQNGDIDAARSMEILKGWSNPDSPRGPIRIDPETRDIIQNIYLRRVEKVNGTLTNVEFATVPAVKDPWKELNPP
jgi:branched-chain amino acid transport system substrate-binding protein